MENKEYRWIKWQTDERSKMTGKFRDCLYRQNPIKSKIPKTYTLNFTSDQITYDEELSEPGQISRYLEVVQIGASVDAAEDGV